MPTNLKKTSLYLTKEQTEFLDHNCISLSKFVRKNIEQLMEIKN